MLNGYEFDRPCSMSSELLLDAVVRELGRLGYTLAKREERQATLKYDHDLAVSQPPPDDANPRLTAPRHHRVHVTAHPDSLHFAFTTGIIASYWTEADRVAVEAIARRALDAAERGPYRGPDRG